MVSVGSPKLLCGGLQRTSAKEILLDKGNADTQIESERVVSRECFLPPEGFLSSSILSGSL